MGDSGNREKGDIYTLDKISSGGGGRATLHRKFETKIPRNETARPRSQVLNSCICERIIYSHERSAYFAVLRLRTDPGNL
jgi:hypothetical protein